MCKSIRISIEGKLSMISSVENNKIEENLKEQEGKQLSIRFSVLLKYMSNINWQYIYFFLYSCFHHFLLFFLFYCLDGTDIVRTNVM